MRDSRGIARTIALLGALVSVTAPPLQSQQRARSAIPSDAAPVATSFLGSQLSFPRVSLARAEKKASLEARFSGLGIPFPPAGLYIRVFKVERVVEVWVQPKRGERYLRLVTYPVCAVSGWLGPKRGQGDLQIPEGFYEVESFNPVSEYHLSLRVNYPNEADRLAGMPAATGLGGDIYLHGGCETIGCVPITDEHIKELYWLAVEARAAGVRRIPVHIFPTRLDDAGLDWLGSFFGGEPELMAFWERMKLGYDFFQEERRVPGVRSEPGGLYSVGEAVEVEGGVNLLGAPVVGVAEAAPEPESPPAAPAQAPVSSANTSRAPVFLGVPVDSLETTADTGEEQPGTPAEAEAAETQSETPVPAASEPAARGLVLAGPADTGAVASDSDADPAATGAIPTDTRAADGSQAPPQGEPAGGVRLLGDPIPARGTAGPAGAVFGADDVPPEAPMGPRLLGRPRLLGTAIEDAPPSPHASFIIPLRQRDGSERARHGIPWRLHVPRLVW